MIVKSKGQFTTIKNEDFKIVLCSVGASIFDIMFHHKHMITNTASKNEHACNGTIYYGKTAGRICGRVPQCKLVFHDKTYMVDQNDGNNSLHGGKDGISTKDFNTVIETGNDFVKVIYSYLDKDNENGYPGNVEIKVIYTVKKDNQVLIEFESLSDIDTPINLTNHAYYNLGGYKTILDHTLSGNIKGFYEADNETLVNTSKLLKLPGVDPVKGFKLGELIYSSYFQEFFQHGIDHCFRFNGKTENVLHLSSENFSMELKTDYPCFQSYGTNYIGVKKGLLNNGHKDCVYSGIAIEPQEIPLDFDGMNSCANKTKHRWMSIQFFKGENNYGF